MLNPIEVTQTVVGKSVVPFTSGLFAVYAFLWPESFGHWFGSIVLAFRQSAGF